MQIRLIVVGMFGLQFCWAVVTIFVTPLLLGRYQVPMDHIGFVRTSIPITSWLAQQLVGGYSDSLGQRSIFFKAGAIGLAASMLVLPHAHNVTPSGVSPLWAGVVALWLYGGGMNTCLITLRAATADLIPAHLQTRANSTMALAAGLGQLAG
eukprot:CAMPEP_0113949178 /NCGR_PEP_ID=MMETSP1339-20121228/74373_1 /TAXON_ID=94617 /ORGANISM="Fibrocapsa japonica" /LENGTH=151 /DNA_ID=CAMNT_0000956547 /DNA_START=36 /DNA_END=487 /DNA_ORIENTATION=- /assembly_acc=CAM_ASM_000762